MNQLRAWLYGRDIESRWPDTQGQQQNKIYQEESSGVSSQQGNVRKEAVAADNSSQNETSFTDSPIRRLLLKVVPLQPGDCLGCKLVGTTVMVASGVIVLTSAIAGRARNQNIRGQKRLIYNIVCGSLFVGFEAAAVCRFFDLGPFAKISQFQNQRRIDQQN